jgi:hypothetical protein
MDVELDLDKSPNIIFTKEDFDAMKRRIYWALISAMFALTLGLLLNLNLFIMFFILLAIGLLNPDDRIKGRFI